MNNNYKKPTIQDVAKLAGVSITTVSRVINKNYPVRESTKKKVEKAIDTLGFKPNLLARALIQDKTKTIGILTPSIENLFFSEVVKGIDSYVRKEGYDTFLCNTEGLAVNEQRMIDNLKNRNVDGIISIDPRTENIKNGYYEELTKHIPLVLINGYNEGITCNFVMNDEKGGMIQSLKHLIELGHSKIAFLRGRRSYSYDIKEAIYKEYMKKEGLNEKLIIHIESGNELDTVNLSKKAVKEYLKKNEDITAIIACNDWMAVGALNAAIELGIDVPSKLSIIGFDNTIISQITKPKLTTVDQNMNNLGVLAARRIFQLLEKDNTIDQKIILDTKLIIRETTSSKN